MCYIVQITELFQKYFQFLGRLTNPIIDVLHQNIIRISTKFFSVQRGDFFCHLFLQTKNGFISSFHLCLIFYFFSVQHNFSQFYFYSFLRIILLLRFIICILPLILSVSVAIQILFTNKESSLCKGTFLYQQPFLRAFFFQFNIMQY